MSNREQSQKEDPTPVTLRTDNVPSIGRGGGTIGKVGSSKSERDFRSIGFFDSYHTGVRVQVSVGKIGKFRLDGFEGSPCYIQSSIGTPRCLRIVTHSSTVGTTGVIGLTVRATGMPRQPNECSGQTSAITTFFSIRFNHLHNCFSNFVEIDRFLGICRRQQ